MYRLCLMDLQAGHRPVVISLLGSDHYTARLEQAGIPVISLNMGRGGFSPQAPWKLYRILRSIRPATVQTWLYHADLVGGLVARAAGCSNVVWSIRGALDLRLTSLRTRLVIALCARLSHTVPRLIISCSRQAADEHVRAGYDSSKIAVIPNGIPLDRFRPLPEERERIRHELGVDSDAMCLGMVARYDPYKDHNTLLGALELLRAQGHKFVCVLAGTGMTGSNQELAKLASAAGLRDHLVLIGPRDDVPALMNAFDINVLSSVGEAFPNVLIEAMACGTPCVSTDVGDAPIIIGETGWLAPPKNPHALSRALQEAIIARQDHTGWSERKAACRRRAAILFDVRQMWTAYNTAWGREQQESEGPFPRPAISRTPESDGESPRWSPL